MIRDGSLSANSEEIAGSITENEQPHATLQAASQEVEQMIKRKLIAGYKLRAPLMPPLNQKHASGADFQKELNLKGELPYKTLHTEKMREQKEQRYSKQSNAKKSFDEGFQGKYFEKREGDKILFRKVQISGNQLEFEEGYIDKDGEVHCNGNTKVECDDEETARRRMECYFKGRERSGYKSLDYPDIEETKTEEIYQDDEEEYENNLEKPKEDGEFSWKRNKGKKTILSYRPADWPESKDPKGFYLREKLNGIICIWDGESNILSLFGHAYSVPEEFRRGFPKVQFVGIVYLGAGESFYVGMRSIQMEKWKNLKFIVYDAPNMHLPFKERMTALKKMITETNSSYLKLCDYVECESRDHFEKGLDKAEANNGEGVFLNDPKETLISGATGGFYLSKIYMEREAVVVGYGREGGEKGKVKTLKVRNQENGCEFSISRGVDKVVKRHLPKIGSTILFKTMGEKLKGCLKMPIYVGVVGGNEGNIGV